MAIAPPVNGLECGSDSFAEALNGLAVGIVSLGFARRALAAVLAEGGAGAAGARSLIVKAWEEGRLSHEDYEALVADLGHDLREDDPTEWSEAVVSEFAPTGDTARQHSGPAEQAGGQPHAAPLVPGAVLRERFVLHARLEASSMNAVYKALDRRRQEAGADNSWVAIKLVGPEFPRYREALRLLQQEAALAQRLDHPHIVRVFDFDRDGEHAFITMEWLEGESLGQLLTRQRHRPLTSALARQVLAEIADALQFAHSRVITHADVKPGNIFLTRDGPVKLLDFGIARAADASAGEPRPEARTPAYASCEVLEGQNPTPQDDVFSLACVAYRMLAGRRVFGHDDALTAERAGRRPVRIRRLTDTQWRALEQALAFRREARTADVASFIQAFNAPPPAPPVVHAPAAVATPPPAAKPRRPGLALATGVALLAVAILLWRSPTEAPRETVATAAASRDPPPDLVGPPRPDPAARAPEPAPPRTASAPPVKPAARATLPRERPPQTATAPPRPAPPSAAAEAAREPAPAATQAGPTPMPGAPIASEPVTMNDRPAPPPPQAAAATAAPTGSAASIPPAEEPAQATPSPASPQQVSLDALEFRRYVEPKPRRRTLGPDPAGWVELSFVVDARGETRDVTVTGASPPGHYDESAIAAVKRWRFEPPTEGGRPVERRTAVRLRFQPE